HICNNSDNDNNSGNTIPSSIKIELAETNKLSNGVCSKTRTAPFVGGQQPVINLSNVDFRAPFRPPNPTIAFSPMCKLTLSSARTDPNRLLTLLQWIILFSSFTFSVF